MIRIKANATPKQIRQWVKDVKAETLKYDADLVATVVADPGAEHVALLVMELVQAKALESNGWMSGPSTGGERVKLWPETVMRFTDTADGYTVIQDDAVGDSHRRCMARSRALDTHIKANTRPVLNWAELMAHPLWRPNQCVDRAPKPVRAEGYRHVDVDGNPYVSVRYFDSKGQDAGSLTINPRWRVQPRSGWDGQLNDPSVVHLEGEPAPVRPPAADIRGPVQLGLFGDHQALDPAERRRLRKGVVAAHRI